MANLRKVMFFICFLVPLAGLAAVGSGDFPSATVWYLHADLSQMQESESGRPVYEWLESEVFAEVRREIGIDLGREIDSVTAFSSTGDNTVIVLEGSMSREMRDKTIAVATLKAQLDKREHEGTTYYRAWDFDQRKGGDQGSSDSDSDDNPLHDLDREAYFGFVDRRLIVTSREGEMQSMIENGGRITGAGSHDGAIFVLTADKAFVQAGLRTDALDDDEDGWKSNIVRNTEQAAVLVSEMNDHLAIEAQLVSRKPEMAASIGGIVNGLIGLQAFNQELDPTIRDVLENTRVEVDKNVLSVRTVVDPTLIVSVLSD